MLYALIYVSILLPFCLMDAIWLSVMGSLVYKPTLGDILLPTVNLPPAIAFYAMYPVGVLVFAVLPALKADSAMVAVLSAALFGALAYATYDLTNFATLRNWTLQITLLDVAWGGFASAVAAAAAFYITRTVGPWLGVA